MTEYHSWKSAAERITRAVKYSPYRRISEIMNLARVTYSDVHRAIANDLIQSDNQPIPSYVITTKGRGLVQ